eukprot:COSAG06_NODE_19373_length_841_cov_1.459569_2_plen_42_part_01
MRAASARGANSGSKVKVLDEGAQSDDEPLVPPREPVQPVVDE